VRVFLFPNPLTVTLYHTQRLLQEDFVGIAARKDDETAKEMTYA
jgi:hypothetical protein